MIETYAAMHAVLRRGLGAASSHLCCWCLGRARDWAYLHDDPEEIPSARGPWSTRVESYAPMCKRCHHRFDEQVDISRNAAMAAAANSGQGLSSIAREHGVSRQRVHQIVARSRSHRPVH